MQRIINVTTPTLTAYLPDPAKATGTAVIIAPGRGFIFLGTDTHEVAEWLTARGLAAFVLKYRTAQLEGQNEAQILQTQPSHENVRPAHWFPGTEGIPQPRVL